ncbi:DUF4334 domain-containing protein [Thermocrispum municipale]|jgi:hypothetical protein|uniref:DUF4334 domain-containing protein n=1 Tax=Thermocrispum municipale TaxID=37926 RepID=UPI001B7F9F12|nr:DUF4334 domain-containing protein [Thermocrispum municipale]
MTDVNASARLAELKSGCTLEQALALFDDLPTVRSTELTGRWKGAELPTGHPMDGLLTASGWYGKQFDGPEDVHPLLFSADGEVFAVDPRKLPVGVADRLPLGAVDRVRKALPVLRPALRTRKPRARLRDVEYRGKVSAAMVYDHLPIIDNFRRVDEDTLLGAMDQRGAEQPYFFLLYRER